MSPLPEIVIGIPGLWTDRSELIGSIIQHSDGYVFAGNIMLHVETKAACRVEVVGRDPRMREAFEIAGGGDLSAADLDAIERHAHVVYLIGNGGSFENARTMMRAAQALLRCGGLAVKVESAGIAHSAGLWTELTDDPLPTAPLRAFVTYVGEPGEFYSCGMHNLGFRDAVLTGAVPPAIAGNTLATFLRYIALEDPTIRDGETFSVDPEAPRYRLTRAEQTAWPVDDPFYNPYGVWRLAPL